jgi:hypothetical protein
MTARRRLEIGKGKVVAERPAQLSIAMTRDVEATGTRVAGRQFQRCFLS